MRIRNLTHAVTVSKKQQRFFGMVRRSGKGKWKKTPEVAEVAATMKPFHKEIRIKQNTKVYLREKSD